MPKQLPVHRLTPAAARLWAASLTQVEGETYASIVQRSGIREYQTYETARQLLLELGFLVLHNGRDCPVLFAQEDPETTRVTQPVATMWPGTITKVTTAKQ